MLGPSSSQSDSVRAADMPHMSWTPGVTCSVTSGGPRHLSCGVVPGHRSPQRLWSTRWCWSSTQSSREGVEGPRPPGGNPARAPRLSLRPALPALSPPLQGLAQGLYQPVPVVADVVMCQAQQLVHILLAVGHVGVVVGGVGRRQVHLSSRLLLGCPRHPCGERAVWQEVGGPLRGGGRSGREGAGAHQGPSGSGRSR